MKKIVTSICLCLAFLFCSAQALQPEAKNFIDTYFPNNQIVNVQSYSDGTCVAELDMEVQIQFDNHGAWLYVLSMHQDITHLVSDKIKNYLVERGNNPANICRIQSRWQGSGTRLTFNDGLIYLFDANGNFVREDFD